MPAMNSSAMPRDPLMPQPLAGRGVGLVLTVLAHGLLLLALTLAVNWRVSTPSPVEAELWAEVPRAAPPVAVQPPQPPVEPVKPVVKPPEPRTEPKPSRAEQDAQIATEKAKREKEREEVEKKRKEEEKKLAEKKAEQERREKADKAEKEAKQKEKEAQLAREETRRQQNIDRMMKGITPPGPPGADYAGQLQKYIRDRVSFPPNAPDGSSTVVRIFVTPSGRILNQRIIRSSGNAAHDDAVLRDVQKAEKIPVPPDRPIDDYIDVTINK